MPSSSDSASVPGSVAPVVRRYQRIERALTGLLALLFAVSAGVAMTVYSVSGGLLAAVVVVALVRLPVFTTGGAARLRADNDPEAVAAAFTGATPPPLSLQWGIADRVRSTESGAIYEITYLFGLRTARIETTVEHVTATADAEREITLTVRADGQPLGTYHIAIQEDTAGSRVTVEWSSDRRLGLQRLLQWALARRYRPAALAAQGYRVDEYESSLSL